MDLGNSISEIAENKLILLYIIDKIKMEITNIQLTKIILENKFINYFVLQQFLDELIIDELVISRSEAEKNFYSISKKGKQSLDFFTSHIPIGVKTRIDTTIKSIRKNIKTESFVTADFKLIGENEFIVNCKIKEEDFPLISLEVMVGTVQDARDVCDNWKKHPSEIYADIIKSLTCKRD